MKQHLLLICCSLLFLSNTSSLSAQTKLIPYQELPTSTGLATGSGIFFGASMTSSSITVTYAGPADRWFAFGFGSLMAPADVLMYSNGTYGNIHPVGWFDYNNISPTGPVKDLIQNWTVVSTGTSSPIQRTVTATRALNTGDAIDVVINYNAAGINLIWARGATPDYTIDTHGSTNRAYGINLPWLSAPTASFITSSTTLCAGSSLLYSNISTGGQTSYTWSFQGGSPAVSTSTSPSVTYMLPGTYSVSLTATNSIGSDTYTQVNYVTVTPTAVPTISLGMTSGTNPMCAGSPASFTAITSNGGSSPLFQWNVNNLGVGTNSPAYTTSSLPNPAILTCFFISNAACVSPVFATSAPLTLTVNSTAPATASISLTTGNNPMCNGSPVTFTVVGGNGGTTPTYQWNLNGLNTGNTGSTYASNALINGDIVNCLMTSNSPCTTSTLGISAGITMTVSSILVPSVSVGIAAGNNPVCAGSPIVFTATPVNGGVAPIYQWKINGANVGTNSASFSSSNLNNGSVLSCVMVSGLSCSSPSAATSAVTTVTVIPLPPTPAITAQGSTTFCAGGSVVLNSSASAGNLWSSGAVTPSVLVTSSGNFTVTQTVNGCASLSSPVLTVTVNPLPNVNLGAINDVCASTDPVELTQGSPSGGVYSGTGVTGTVFSPVQSGIGTFVISYSYTDANNCANTATVSLFVDACLSIKDTKGNDSGVSIFPNPTSGQLTVSAANEKINSLRVTDMTGSVVLKRKFKTESSILVDLSGETAGIYLFEITLEKTTVYSRISKKD